MFSVMVAGSVLRRTEKHGLRPHPTPLEFGLEFNKFPERSVRQQG